MMKKSHKATITGFVKFNKGTLALMYYPERGQSYNGAIATLSEELQKRKENNKYVDSVALYLCKKDQGAYLVFATGRVKDMPFNDITYNQIEKFLCDIQALPVSMETDELKTVVYNNIDDFLVCYRGVKYPNKVFREEDRSKMQHFLNSLEPITSNTRLYDAVKRIMGVLQKDDRLKHVVETNIYISALVPGITSISTRINDEQQHAMKELKNSIILHKSMGDETQVPEDQTVIANIARAIVTKALQKHTPSGMPLESRVNEVLKEKFGFTTAYDCINCGKPLTVDYIYCPHCKAKIASGQQEKAIVNSRKKFTKYYPQTESSKPKKL